MLRIEDTDQERNSEEYLNVIKDGMRWLGLDWDEGPDVGGEYGPYFQSQRSDIYREYLEILRGKGRAYDKDGAVFFKVSGQKQVLHDAVYGDVERLEEKDFPIFRSNGTPVFHFVNVVDDICMQISHVIRGQDHLTNTNKHIELFKAFGAPIPQFAHIPLILKSVGQGKMSKRDKGALIEEYQAQKFLPEAVRNYLCLLGWNPKNNLEIMDISEIISLFDFPGIIKSNARFDERKMAHFNTEHIRRLAPEKFCGLARKVAQDAGVNIGTDPVFADRVFLLCQPKTANMEAFPSLLAPFFNDNFEYDALGREKLFKKGDPALRARELLEFFDALPEIDADRLHGQIEAFAEAKSAKASEYLPALRYAISGQSSGPDLMSMAAILGKEKVVGRLKRFLLA